MKSKITFSVKRKPRLLKRHGLKVNAFALLINTWEHTGGWPVDGVQIVNKLNEEDLCLK